MEVEYIEFPNFCLSNICQEVDTYLKQHDKEYYRVSKEYSLYYDELYTDADNSNQIMLLSDVNTSFLCILEHEAMCTVAKGMRFYFSKNKEYEIMDGDIHDLSGIHDLVKNRKYAQLTKEHEGNCAQLVKTFDREQRIVYELMRNAMTAYRKYHAAAKFKATTRIMKELEHRWC